MENLVAQYAASLERARALCDEATPSGEFLRVSLEQMRKHGQLCEDAIAHQVTHIHLHFTQTIIFVKVIIIGLSIN